MRTPNPITDMHRDSRVGICNNNYSLYISEHWLNGIRLTFILLWGAVGLRETFQLLDDPECDRLGRQSWVLLAIVATEFLICVKFGWATITKPLPRSIALWWLAGLGIAMLYTVIRFYIFKPTKLPQPEKESIQLSPVHHSNHADTSQQNNKKIL